MQIQDFCLLFLSDLNNKGSENIRIVSIDGRKGFPETIKTIFPQTEVPIIKYVIY
ncbi:MAG: transposase [Poseidonibacter sp.]|uniref:transposase n=1 Tax=Poseidonibacter sp. TaxID=2321188 RepID=UPI001B6991C9|nr:transposase [Aliarcobacter sp.]